MVVASFALLFVSPSLPPYGHVGVSRVGVVIGYVNNIINALFTRRCYHGLAAIVTANVDANMAHCRRRGYVSIRENTALSLLAKSYYLYALFYVTSPPVLLMSARMVALYDGTISIGKQCDEGHGELLAMMPRLARYSLRHHILYANSVYEMMMRRGDVTLNEY